ncbi:coiled-coil domain-containing protein [Bartonella sp. AP72JLCBS]|uniref:coiled-coil domain-containing protein n=1 Tax=Bartonella sp. AP72JLCBS TaxID=3243502 RepID=UPI0035D06C01
MFLVILLVWYFDIISLWTAFIIAIIAIACYEYSLLQEKNELRTLKNDSEYQIGRLKDVISASEAEIEKLKDEIYDSEAEIEKLKDEIKEAKNTINYLRYTIFFSEEKYEED